MADCSKTVDFIKEFHRMCQYGNSCSECPLHDVECACQHIPTEDIDKVIQIVQKWSDEHSERSELKPCPICGSDARITIKQECINPFFVHCTKFGCIEMRTSFKSRQRAAEAWNRRTYETD